jgi:hypothetical protein
MAQLQLHSDSVRDETRQMVFRESQNKTLAKFISQSVGLPLLNFLYQLVKTQSPDRMQNIKVAFGTLFMYYTTIITYYLHVKTKYNILFTSLRKAIRTIW